MPSREKYLLHILFGAFQVPWTENHRVIRNSAGKKCRKKEFKIKRFFIDELSQIKILFGIILSVNEVARLPELISRTKIRIIPNSTKITRASAIRNTIVKVRWIETVTICTHSKAAATNRISFLMILNKNFTSNF